ncbi:MAG: TetR/AcrR family transcriptional regulator [Thermomicrobiales bacterium]
MSNAPSSPGSTTVPRRRNPRGQGARLRDEIIEAASALLAESGDAKQLSLRGVAKQVGIVATSVYPHFSDVEQLAAAVAERRFAEMFAAQNTAERGIVDPAEALLARCLAYCHFALAHPSHYQVMFQVDLTPVRVEDFTHLPGRQAFEALVRAIERCLEAGVARPHDDPFRLAVLVWAAEHGLVALRISRPRFPWPPLDELVNEAVRYLVGLERAGDQ